MGFLQEHIDQELLFRDHIRDLTSLEGFLNHAVRQKASDVIIQTGEPAIAMVHGSPIQLTNYKVQASQIDGIASMVVNSQTIKSALAGGDDFNHAFDIPDQDHANDFGVAQRHRFRLNATAIRGRGGESKQLVLRHIEHTPPTMDIIAFPDELRAEIGLQQGMFLIAGETGSGKTTTFAACLRYIIEGNTPIKGNIVTFEDPIEYIFSDLDSSTCVVAQSEIGEHIKSFAHGVINAMRRKPSLIVIGEMRDPHTIKAANDAAITGHPVFGTVHANDSSVIIRRMLTQYEFQQQAQAFSEIVGNIKILMSQSLAPKVNAEGEIVGRVCLRDWCLIDPERAEQMLRAGPGEHVALIREWQRKGDRARSMQRSITIEYEQGNITQDTADLWLKRYGYDELEGAS